VAQTVLSSLSKKAKSKLKTEPSASPAKKAEPEMLGPRHSRESETFAPNVFSTIVAPVFRLTLIFLLFLSLAQGQTMTLAKVKRHPDYKSAKVALADYLPDLAITKLNTLLSKKKLSKDSKKHLLPLLGEAYLRNGQLAEAQKTLSDPLLTNSSEAAFWRAQTSLQEGQLLEAAEIFALVDSKTRKSSSRLAEASIRLNLGEAETAEAILLPLLKSKDKAFVTQIKLRLASLYLDTKQYPKAEEQLKTLTEKSPTEQYLRGRLYLAKKQRILAVGIFQTLTGPPSEETKVSAEIYHASLLGLADSLALEGNEAAAVNALLTPIDESTAAPVIDECFARLRKWRKQANQLVLIERIRSWLPVATTPEEKLPIRSSYALHLLGLIQLDSEDEKTRNEGIAMIQQVTAKSAPSLRQLLARAHYDLGLAYLRGENAEEALKSFSAMAKIAPSQSSLQAQALAEKALAQIALKKPEEATTLFLDAQKIAPPHLAERAALYAGLSLIGTKDFRTVKAIADVPTIRLDLLLERGKVLAAKGHPDAREVLETFLAEAGEHPRRDEAALTLAETAITITNSAVAKNERDQAQALASQIISKLKFDPETQPSLAARQALAALSINLKDGENEFAAHLTKEFLSKNPKHETSTRIRFELARYYLREEYPGDARTTLEELLVEAPEDHPLADPARLMSARAALASRSDEAFFDKSIQRYDELIKKDGPLAIDAALEKASTLIDATEAEAALATLQPFLKRKKLSAIDRRRLLVKAADAAEQLSQYQQALAYYDELLTMESLPISWRNRASLNSPKHSIPTST